MDAFQVTTKASYVRPSCEAGGTNEVKPSKNHGLLQRRKLFGVSEKDWYSMPRPEYDGAFVPKVHLTLEHAVA